MFRFISSEPSLIPVSDLISVLNFWEMGLISANGKRYFRWNLPSFITWILLLFASTVDRLVFPRKWWATKKCLRLNSILNKTHPSRSYKQYSRVNRKNARLNVALEERERDQGILCEKNFLKKSTNFVTSPMYWQLHNTILVYSWCLTIYKSV